MPLRVGTAEGPGRLDLTLARLFPDLSRSRAAALIKEGVVSVDGRFLHKPGAELRGGEAIEVDVPESAPSATTAEDLPLRIVYEDADVAVIDKDAGMVVHPAPGHANGTLVNALLHHLEDLSGVGGVDRPGIVHRLDKGTSGLLVVAKSDVAHRCLQAQFADHSAGRTYLALCFGVPREASGTVRSNLGRYAHDRQKFCTVQRGGRPAVTHWTRVAVSGSLSLIQCQLETGRTHQVRVHLSESGWPIVGDPLYGPDPQRLPATLKGRVDDDRPLLHAWRLRFRHPDGREMAFGAPLPEDFVRALENARLPVPTLESTG